MYTPNLKAYDGKDMIRNYGHGRWDTPFLSLRQVEEALSGGHVKASAFLKQVLITFNHKLAKMPQKELEKHASYKLVECDDCDRSDPEDSDDEREPARHHGVFFSGQARECIGKGQAGHNHCSFRQLVDASDKHFDEVAGAEIVRRAQQMSALHLHLPTSSTRARRSNSLITFSTIRLRWLSYDRCQLHGHRWWASQATYHTKRTSSAQRRS